MTKILVHLADGFEEMEAVIPIDVWRRAGYDVETVAIGNEPSVCGAHHITLLADRLFEDTNYENADMIFLPGGIPGATNLDAHEGLQKEIINFNKANKTLGAICAAPLVLGHNNLLKNRKATCFPGFEKELYNAEYTGSAVQVDGNIITGKGAGVAFEFALEVVKHFSGNAAATELAKKMQMNTYQ